MGSKGKTRVGGGKDKKKKKKRKRGEGEEQWFTNSLKGLNWGRGGERNQGHPRGGITSG